MSASVGAGALKHHFEDIEQQRGAERLGMWMFLTTEILFFGGVFLAYTVYRLYYPKDFADISGRLNIAVAGLNTLLLLTSSGTGRPCSGTSASPSCSGPPSSGSRRTSTPRTTRRG